MVLAEDASLPSSDVALPRESLKGTSSCADMKACVPQDQREHLQRLCTFCPIAWKRKQGLTYNGFVGMTDQWSDAMHSPR